MKEPHHVESQIVSFASVLFILYHKISIGPQKDQCLVLSVTQPLMLCKRGWCDSGRWRESYVVADITGVRDGLKVDFGHLSDSWQLCDNLTTTFSQLGLNLFLLAVSWFEENSLAFQKSQHIDEWRLIFNWLRNCIIKFVLVEFELCAVYCALPRYGRISVRTFRTKVCAISSLSFCVQQPCDLTFRRQRK